MDRVLRRRQVAVRRRWCGEVRNREACLGSPSALYSGPFALCDVCVSDKAGERNFWRSTSSVTMEGKQETKLSNGTSLNGLQ